MPAAEAPTAAGILLVLAIITPFVGVGTALLAGRHAREVVLCFIAAGLVIALAIGAAVWNAHAPLGYALGGYAPPLGLALRADGLSVAMLLIAAAVIALVAIFAGHAFARDPAAAEQRAPLTFWLLLLAILGSLNLIFLGRDLFNFYVGLELLTFSAVPLVCLKSSPETLRAALRYLIFALLGSILYLLGVALLYGAYGVLDVGLLAEAARPEPALWIALALMTAGLMAKTALFPLHLWLPPAHAGAPPPASAILSALVVKGSFFIVLRLWFDVMPTEANRLPPQLLGLLGAGAIIYGSVLALQQARLKLLIAYSTVAQIGYLFLMFPLALGAAEAWESVAFTGGILQLAAHAFAKAAMFLAAGLIAERLGHDRIDGLAGVAQAMPTTFFALALAGVSLMGLPPSGGFSAKWMLLGAAAAEGQWWWAVVILAGGLIAAAYIFRVVGTTLAAPAEPLPPTPAAARLQEWAALGLAAIAILLGFLPLEPWPLLEIGGGPGGAP